MKKSSLFTFLLMVFTISCNSVPENNSTQLKLVNSAYVDISVTEFNATYAQPDSNIVLLDVRTDREHNIGAIPNSIQIDLMSPDFKTKVATLDPSKEYIVYCETGRRSVVASKIMTQELGFKDVKNLEGGYSIWSKSE